jgi:hypothetical protein
VSTVRAASPIPDGTALVEWRPLTDTELVPSAIAHAIGVREIVDPPLSRTIDAGISSLSHAGVARFLNSRDGGLLRFPRDLVKERKRRADRP